MRGGVYSKQISTGGVSIGLIGKYEEEGIVPSGQFGEKKMVRQLTTGANFPNVNCATEKKYDLFRR